MMLFKTHLLYALVTSNVYTEFIEISSHWIWNQTDGKNGISQRSPYNTYL